jgi:DNA-binding MarR family transcriptional regulator
VTDATPLNPAQLAAYLALTEVSSLLGHAVDQQLRVDGDLSRPQFQILARLNVAPAGRLRMTDLADGLVYSRSGLTYQAGLLEKSGLVTRSPGEDDERSVTVTLTEAGRDRLNTVMPGHVEIVQRLMLSALSDDDIATLTGVLGRIRAQMRKAPPRSAAPRPERGNSPRRARD